MDTAKSRSEGRGQDISVSHFAALHESASSTQSAAWWQRAWRIVTGRHEYALAALLVLGLALYVAGLGQRSLWAPDEGRYAEIPREMVATGDWLTPRLNGLVYVEKPPLQYWLTAASFQAFGS